MLRGKRHASNPLKPLWPEFDAAAWRGKALDKSHYTECVLDEATALKDDGGVLFKVLRNRLPFDACKAAFPVLCTAHQDAAFRIIASGRAKPGENGVSDVMGFLDGTERYGLIQCRETAWSIEHFLEQENDVMPLSMRSRRCFPRGNTRERYAAQLEQVMKTHPAWRLKNEARMMALDETVNNQQKYANGRPPG